MFERQTCLVTVTLASILIDVAARWQTQGRSKLGIVLHASAGLAVKQVSRASNRFKSEGRGLGNADTCSTPLVATRIYR